ncbi:MAG: HD domain-containing protein [Bdellovibrionaceae bacterium]|nr:HD domain-containing protein [Pseudobdellovibrionaceae bacterium]
MLFSPIRISLLRGDQKTGFDVYVEIGGKHILYLRKGDSFEAGRLNRLKEKKIKKMFIRQEDEENYRNYLARNIEMGFDKNSGQSLENRSQIVQGVQQSAAEEVFENPTDQGAYSSAKSSSERFAEFLMKEDKAIHHLLALENTDQSLAHHGVTVASLAVEIAKTTGFTDTKGINFISLGGLLHDVGHHMSGLNIARPLSELSADEMKIYREHPAKAATTLKDLKHVDKQVALIIMEHEENIAGTGFPQKLTEKKIDPLSLFVQTANAVDRKMTFEKTPAAEIIKMLFTPAFLGRHPLPHLNAIKTILQSK